MNKISDFAQGSKRIGILGATGIIGQSLAEILQQKKLTVLKGSRGLENGPDTKKVNIDEPRSLKEFIDRCDIIINCTGPSLLTNQKILPAVVNAGKDYIDAFGWTNSKDSLKQEASRIILNAGSVPGMLSVLIRSMYKAETQEMKVWSGGREGGSIGSVGDIILSSINGYGESNCYIEDSETVKNKNLYLELFDGAEELPDKISTQLILTSEIRSVVKYLGVQNIRNYTIWAEERMKRIIMFGCVEASRLKKEEDLNKLFSTVLREINQLNKSKQPWFTIVIKSIEEYETTVLRLDTNDSSKLTAAMLAYMADTLIHHEVAGGVYWPFELADSGEVLHLIQNLGISVDIHGEL